VTAATTKGTKRAKDSAVMIKTLIILFAGMYLNAILAGLSIKKRKWHELPFSLTNLVIIIVLFTVFIIHEAFFK
jgi:hypothetical protein